MQMQRQRRGWRLRSLVALGAVLAMASLAGCGGTTQGGSQPAGKSGGTAAPKEITIGLAAPELKGSFWVSIYYGVDDEAKKQGVKLVALEAGGYDNLQRHVEQIENLIQKKVTVIVDGAVDSQGDVPAVEEAVAAGIPVIGLSGIPNTPKIAAAVGADHYGMGAIEAQCVGAALNGKGKVALASGPAGVLWANQRSKGFKDTLNSKFPGISIVGEKSTPTGRDQGLKLMEEWMQAFPDLGGVYTASDDIAAGMVDALKAAGKVGSVKIASANLSPIGKQYLLDGNLTCEAIQQIVLQGREAVRTAVKIARGEKVEANLQTPVLEVTKENISKLDLSQFQAPDGYKPGV